MRLTSDSSTQEQRQSKSGLATKTFRDELAQDGKFQTSDWGSIYVTKLHITFITNNLINLLL